MTFCNDTILNRHVAVHFNFQSGLLSVRDINQKTGKLSALFGLVSRIELSNAVFTYDIQKWERWRAGKAPHVRQFAEIRGIVRQFQASEGGAGNVNNAKPWHKISYNPYNRPDFHDEKGKEMSAAQRVFIQKRNIFALI